jgi:hypothetical protein
MSEPRVRIRFDGNRYAYGPGDTLSGEYRLESISADDVRAIEVSVLWFTEGKGDEDLAVHSFERIEPTDEAPADLRRPSRFRTVLPGSPLSYRGLIVKVHWCVRVRVFLARGKDVVGQREFQIGAVPAVQLPIESSESPQETSPDESTLDRPAKPNGPSTIRKATA